MTKQPTTLEQRIAVALQPDTSITSTDVTALIEETEARIAETEKAGTIDQTLSLNANAARQAIAEASFTANRLRTLLSRLQARYQQVCEQEGVDEYNAEAGVLDEESVRLAEELRPKYPTAQNEITDLFVRIAAHRQRISALHQRRPPGVEKKAH